ncbi:protein FAR1-RELATED SEQUENCE 6 [Sesamum angolense]|uniref:Protein FAR1-RELATED SEQUENCE n=1 Tax=Sesamum angolense TaxID=2727404 RepID=A0AAE1WL41_9LAMI|nr:protein FAR1-RELATED SEQUENCE 6 [Sesamum angolense]
MDEVSLNGEAAYDDEAEGFEIDGECAMTEYVGQTGFGVRVSNTWYRKSKERYRGKLSCSSAGFKKKSDASRPRPETRTGCPAMIKFRLMENKRWRIIEVELEHNHLTSSTSSKFYKSHRITDLGSKRPLPINGSEEVRKIRLFRTVVIDAEDNGFASLMKLGSPSFFYVMDINEKGCLRNGFWAETMCRPAYGYFGDVIFIDTTTLIDKYEVPLVVFTGVNHHAQPMSLGCGLVSSQTVESFTWLFRAWLTYMVGRPPQTVITSQCKALQAAISEVFPRAFHCLSLTNIMKKVPSELGSLEEMVQSYRLIDHKWLQMLYEDRKRWIPVYLKEVFLAEMFTVKENERLTSPFEEYLSPHTSLKQFFSSYDRALLEINQRETLSDLESKNSSCMLKSRFYFELQLSRLYTNSIFKKFQDEIEGMYTCFSVRQMNIDGSTVTYIVKEDIQVEENWRETRDFEVMYNASDAEVVCACGLFNFRGYLCRHALSVINQIGLEEIPPQYILARWRKDINRSYISNHGWNGIDVNNPVHRYDNLYKSALKVVEEGRKSHDRYKFTIQSLDEILNKQSWQACGQLP